MKQFCCRQTDRQTDWPDLIPTNHILCSIEEIWPNIGISTHQYIVLHTHTILMKKVYFWKHNLSRNSLFACLPFLFGAMQPRNGSHNRQWGAGAGRFYTLVVFISECLCFLAGWLAANFIFWVHTSTYIFNSGPVWLWSSYMRTQVTLSCPE